MKSNKDSLSTIQTLSNIIKKSENNFNIKDIFNELLFFINTLYPDEYDYHFNKINNLIYHIENYIFNKRQANKPIIIGLGGGFSAGKSRFINSLLGVTVLPEDIGATTAVATQVGYADMDFFNVLNVFDNTIAINENQMLRLRHNTNKEYAIDLNKIIKKIYYFTPKNPWVNIDFLDTPGHSKADNQSDISDEQIALDSLSQADYILWLVSADNGTIREDDIAFLQKLGDKQPKYIIITKSDLRNSKDIPDIIQSVKHNLEKNGITYEGVTAWSAPISTDMGTEVYGDGVKQWLDLINQSNKSGIFSDLHSYIDDLYELSKNKKHILESEAKIRNFLYEKIQLSNKTHQEIMDLLNLFLEKIKFFHENIYQKVAIYFDSIGDKEIASYYFGKSIYHAGTIDWLFYHAKTNKRIAINLNNSIKELTNQSYKQKDVRACHLLINIYEEFLTEDRYFDKLANQKYMSAKYHNSEKSLEWLFEKSENYKNVREYLSKILDLESANYNALRYFDVEYRTGDKNIAIDGIFNFAEQNDDGAIQWLFNESNKNKSLLHRLGELYLKNNYLKNADTAMDVFCESVKFGNKNSIDKLYEVIHTFNDIKQIEKAISIYSDVPDNIRFGMLQLYSKLIKNYMIFSDNQKRKILDLFYKYIFDYDDLKIFEEFIGVADIVNLNIGYFLLANIYVYHEEFQDFDKAYKYYKNIADKDIRALYNVNVLTYYGLGTEKSIMNFQSLLRRNKNELFFKDSYQYFFRQILGFKRPMLLDIEDGLIEFENHYIMPTIKSLFLMMIFSAASYLAYNSIIYIMDNNTYNEDYNYNGDYYYNEDDYESELHDSEKEYEQNQEQQIDSQNYIHELNSRLNELEGRLIFVISELSLNEQKELNNDNWHSIRDELCQKEAYNSQEEYEIAYISCQIRKTEYRIGQVESLTEERVLEEKNDQVDNTELIKTKERLEMKRKEFNKLWNTMPKSIQDLLTEDQKRWVEERDRDCLRASYETDGNQELFYNQCIEKKLEERMGLLKNYIASKRELMIEFDKTKNNLEKRKKEFNRFWQDMPLDVQSDLQHEQERWVKQRDQTCSQKARKDKTADPAILEMKCIDSALNQRMLELKDILNERKSMKIKPDSELDVSPILEEVRDLQD